MNSYTKRGGAARRRFCVIYKKPEGGRKSTPPPGVRVLMTTRWLRFGRYDSSHEHARSVALNDRCQPQPDGTGLLRSGMYRLHVSSRSRMVLSVASRTGVKADSQSSRSCREVDTIPIQIHCAEVATTARSVKKYQLRKLQHVFE